MSDPKAFNPEALRVYVGEPSGLTSDEWHDIHTLEHQVFWEALPRTPGAIDEFTQGTDFPGYYQNHLDPHEAIQQSRLREGQSFDETLVAVAFLGDRAVSSAYSYYNTSGETEDERARKMHGVLSWPIPLLGSKKYICVRSIATDEEFRGKGLASGLICLSQEERQRRSRLARFLPMTGYVPTDLPERKTELEALGFAAKPPEQIPARASDPPEAPGLYRMEASSAGRVVKKLASRPQVAALLPVLRGQLR